MDNGFDGIERVSGGIKILGEQMQGEKTEAKENFSDHISGFSKRISHAKVPIVFLDTKYLDCHFVLMFYSRRGKQRDKETT